MDPVTIPQIIERLKKLPPEKLPVVYDFVSSLTDLERKQEIRNSEGVQTMPASEKTLWKDPERPGEDKRIEREKIHQESEAFIAQHNELLKTKKGQYVAMHKGKVVDHDQDSRVLYLRIRKKYGRTPILIRQVTEQNQRVLIFRSPRLEKGKP